MAISQREVQNKRDGSGRLTGRPGTVYDVNIKHRKNGKYHTYAKKGFLTKKDAVQHEAEMRTKLSNPSYVPISNSQGKQTVQEYLNLWMGNHSSNLRPSTQASYRSHIKNHICPYIGDIELRQLTPEMIDSMLKELLEERKLSQSTARYAQRILSVALEAARKYRYIDTNPARDIITKFGKQQNTPDPYTIEQMQQLMTLVMGTEWEMLIMLGGMYGLRRNEILGLRWDNVNLDAMTLSVVEQLPFRVPRGATTIDEFAPTKSHGRTMPITAATKFYFERQLELQSRQRQLCNNSGKAYYDNRLVVSQPNGAPMVDSRVSSNFGQLLRHKQMPHIRFHDLRHTAATNMHEITGDFYTVGEILGHTLKGIGMTLGISTSLDAVTAQYVDVRLERKQTVLEAYHNALHPQA